MSKNGDRKIENSTWGKAIGWVIAILLPVILIMTSIRLLLTPVFVDIEYSMPGFPEDAYGMTFAERRQYAKLALEYLLNDENVSFLDDQRFEDGTPLYNERELGHMEDVKDLAKMGMTVWLLLAALLVGGVAAAWHFGDWEVVRAGLLRGGQITVGLIVAVLVFVALSFNALFTGFHRIFFEGDTWLFQFTDTLIRLFPLRFWQDVFIALGLLTLLGGAALWLGLRKRRGK
ncbi:MAG: TIGR01906 family membrane protein [Anaerolineales bacterium]